MEDGIPKGLQHHYKKCCKKGGHCGRRACMIWRWLHHRDVVSRWVDLHMTVFQLLINNFTILEVEKYTKDASNLSNIFVCSPTISITLTKHSKWEKRLLQYLVINVLNTYRAFLYLTIFLKAINIIESISVYTLVNSSTTKIFIN